MKRKIALLLTVFMVIAAMIPVQIFAESDKGLEDAIKVVKSKITIPDDYTGFNYDISTLGDKRVWNLNWYGKDGVEGSIYARVDEKGTILSYGNYKPVKYSESKKLPKFSKQQAKAIAEDFINSINPGILEKVKYKENSYNSIHDREYYFNYIRVVDGIPFYANSLGISVDCETGEVRNYNFNWSDDASFPSAKEAISMEKAQQAFKDKLGLELKYHYTVDNDKIKTFGAFVQKYRYNTFIDAITGEKAEINPFYGAYYDGYGADKMASTERLEATAKGNGNSGVVLTEEELKAVKEVAKLISREDAEKIARNIKVLELTSDYKVRNANLSRNWPDREEFFWYIDFANEGSNEMGNRYINVAINAVSGEVKSFNTYYNHKDGETAKYDENAAKSAAEALLKELQPTKYSETFYDENNNYIPRPYISSQKPTYYNFIYTRKVNGIPFPGNALRVGYDAINGKVTSFSSDWFDVEFPSVEKAVSLDVVYEKFFNEIGLELQYVTEPKPVEVAKEVYNPNNVETQIRLVYGVKTDKPVAFDADSGNIINFDGTVYKGNKPVEYSDIEGHYAESQIKVLAEYGIALEGTEFNPDQNILQKDFFMLLSKTLNFYMPYPLTKDQKEIDNLYLFLAREGIIKEGEKAPDAAVTREDAVKFIIRALKYDKVADIKGIYKCDFKDAEKITPELIGYVTIAKGLEIINGYNGMFEPMEEMTRAQAAVAIYNYLQK